jgi:hypothetical protein
MKTLAVVLSLCCVIPLSIAKPVKAAFAAGPETRWWFCTLYGQNPPSDPRVYFSAIFQGNLANGTSYGIEFTKYIDATYPGVRGLAQGGCWVEAKHDDAQAQMNQRQAATNGKFVQTGWVAPD